MAHLSSPRAVTARLAAIHASKRKIQKHLPRILNVGLIGATMDSTFHAKAIRGNFEKKRRRKGSFLRRR
jgi:hypothetical protein